MWQELSLVHGKPHPSALGGAAPVWRTCLRQIAFLPPGALYGFPVGEGEIFSGIEAHRFLVEICSGLHSPLLGETEVFGQFRDFREAQVWHAAWAVMLDAVEEDVKKLRRTHLTNLGAQSYGSLTRKRLPEGETVVLVGGGRLAQDLLPWLGQRPLIQLLRNPAKRDTTALDVRGLDARDLPAGAHWVIAAPVENEALLSLMNQQSWGCVLDFRGEAKLAPVPDSVSAYFDLSALFGELESVRSALAVRRESALATAAELSRQREASVHHRPFGWEDAFA